MILCAESGLHFTKDGDRWRGVEHPDLLMLPDAERYWVGGLTFGSLDEAMRHLEGDKGINPAKLSNAKRSQRNR